MEPSLTKKSSKFENFLKKKLDDKTFHRVRGYEACIACWEKENKAFKYVVLTDEHIYLTENPPRTLTQVVCLRNVIAVEVVDDYPNFLSGSERLNTLHVTVRHAVASARLGRERSGSGGSRRHLHPGSMPQSESAPSMLGSSAAPDDGNGDGGELSQMPLQRELSASAALAGSHRSLQAGAELPLTSGQLQAASPPAASRPASAVGSSERGNSPVVFAGGSSHQNRPEESTGRAYGSTGVSKSATTDSASSSAAASLPSAAETDVKSSDCTIASLHLYMLNSESPMFALMQYATDNCAIRSTLMLDTSFSERICRHERTVRCTNEEKIEVQFSTLVQELLTPHSSVESIFELTRELKTAAETDFFLKKLFWKNEALFSFFVSQLHRYVPSSPTKLLSDTASRMRRADELELVILITQTLELMFRETEIFPARLKVLAAHSGRLASQLAAALTCRPELPPRCQLPSARAARLLVQTKADEQHWTADEELQELADEYVRRSTAVVFELILIAQQNHWGAADGSFLNVGWMVRALEHRDSSKYYCEKLIQLALSLMQPSRNVVLSPPDAVFVFQLFTVLQTLIAHSKCFSAHVKSHYREEFKYYLRTHTLAEKLPAVYPISPRALHLIADVIHRVVASGD